MSGGNSDTVRHLIGFALVLAKSHCHRKALSFRAKSLSLSISLLPSLSSLCVCANFRPRLYGRNFVTVLGAVVWLFFNWLIFAAHVRVGQETKNRSPGQKFIASKLKVIEKM